MSVLVRQVLGALLLCGILSAQAGGRAKYIGGTLALIPQSTEGRIVATDEEHLVFRCKRQELRVRYDRINLLEYGQKVDRRIALALIVSPMFLLSKKRDHFLTIGYLDNEGRQQALVFRVDKGDIRTVLVSLEARTGRKVEFQDEEARKAGKG